eukprot:gb/GECH01002859.1/.p1 GENE.gb/GECH01002859.1/~~gb/GECH01002859.1/.p1  ORF type:complete len:288 (+),score=56.63 gb/GECH01002859.1/:1-864(+)
MSSSFISTSTRLPLLLATKHGTLVYSNNHDELTMTSNARENGTKWFLKRIVNCTSSETSVCFSLCSMINDKTVVAHQDGSVSLSQITEDEQNHLFHVERRGRKVILKSNFGYYLCADKQRNQITCDRSVAKGWEEFALIIAPDVRIRIRSPSLGTMFIVYAPPPKGNNGGAGNGYFIGIGDRSRFSVNLDQCDTFQVQVATKYRNAFKTGFDTYLCSEKNGKIQADRTHIREWELFTLIPVSNDGCFQICSKHHSILTAKDDKNISFSSLSKNLDSCSHFEIEVVEQ